VTSPTRRKILILDDDETTLGLLQIAFKSTPFDVTFVNSGIQAAIEVFEAYRANAPFDALVLDCALPRLDGFTLARIVRVAEAAGVGPKAKLGYFTAFQKTVEQSTMLEEVGAEAYWRKPEDMANLPQLVSLWLE
jgi:CheY-like chemotaxis protein